jgi:glycyl-radical enzyme activating protein
MDNDVNRAKEGRIFDIQYFSVHDGPGIRTTVFLKGCPLRCLWCHNPEGISQEKHLSYSENKCIGCGSCTRVCSAHRLVNGRHVLDRTACSGKMLCAGCCPTQALGVVGRDVTVNDVLSEVLRDTRFYETSVTFSGGEPTMQPEFLLNLAMACKNEGLHVAVETSGCCSFGVLASIAPYVDLFLYDCKETDSELHRQYTGVDNSLLKDNLKKLHDLGARILLRCPIICGLNDRDGHFRGIAQLFSQLPNLSGVELLPYHPLAASKSGRMDLLPQNTYETPSADQKRMWNEKLADYGVNVIES